MNRARSLILFASAVYLLVCFAILLSILQKTGGHFVYALDDPYIHLALAENLAHGHYGINPTEFSSPSSSILWPFLLIPFAGTRLHVWLPLVWNLLFGTAAAALIGSAVGRWPMNHAEPAKTAWIRQAATAVTLLFIANLPGLTFLGMEHVLQILLAIACALGIAEVLEGRPIPKWSLAAAIIAPSVRYEDLALTLAVCLVLLFTGERKKSLATGFLSLIPPAIFSAILWSRSHALLPMSVLVKGGAYNQATERSSALKLLGDNLYADLTQSPRYLILALFVAFIALAIQAKTLPRRTVFLASALVAALQLTVGRFGWFHRYEVYALIFLVLILLQVVAETRQPRFAFYLLALSAFAFPYIQGTIETSSSAFQVYAQQYQMHRFVTQFYSGDYAVNDLGLTSFERRPNAYVLDVYGLASAEAATQPDKSAEWLAAIVARHHVPLAMLYEEWFDIPPAWTPLARICLSDQPIAVAEQCVNFYSTVPSADATLKTDLTRFAETLPKGIEFSWAIRRSEEPMWAPSP